MIINPYIIIKIYLNMATPKERAINVRRTNFKIGFDNSEIQSDY